MKPRTLTSLFEAAERGDTVAAEALFAALYGELHRMAKRELAGRSGFVTLGVTTLLHEAYIKMSDRGDGVAFSDRARFMAYAARVMRGLIIDHVRRRRANKRGGLVKFTVLDTTVADQVANETISGIRGLSGRSGQHSRLTALGQPVEISNERICDFPGTAARLESVGSAIEGRAELADEVIPRPFVAERAAAGQREIGQMQ